ncbi:MAG TPA: DUF6629 family protein [Bacteroidia bacterium]|nr:DUF6629 family protein [Bacteroidia bacterium]
MCFSSTASFTTGVLLSVTGFITIKKASARNLVPLAAIPLLFGLQQISEGFVWLTVDGHISQDYLWPFALTFLIFAQVIWPVWVPLAMLLPEPNATRRKILWGMFSLGAMLAIYHLYCFTKFPIAVNASAHHIDYLREFPDRPAKLIAAIYIIVTLAPTFASSIRDIRILGIFVLASFVAALLFYREHLISVWCLFAAVVSVIVVFIIHRFSSQTVPAK